jgi:hypothetical protein
VTRQPGRQTPETQNPPRWRGATPYCLPTVGLIVPCSGWRWHLTGVQQVAGRVIGPVPSAPLLIAI